MPVIDDRGRLFGKVNLIDAIVGLLVLGLIPLAYGAFLLFRVPAPRITSIAPTQVVEHQTVTLQITGEDLRPFLHARVGIHEARAFLIQSPTRAEIKLPDLAVGTYDLTLYDEGQELLRIPGALTVVAPPPPPAPPPLRVDVQAVGAFVALGKENARLIQMGSTFERKDAATSPIAEVLALRSPEPGTQRVRMGPSVFVTAPVPGEMRVPAILRLSCVVVNGECKVGETVVAKDATIPLPWLFRPSEDKMGGPDEVHFLIDEVRPVDAPVAFPSIRTAVAAVRVRFAVGEELLDLIKVGDVDVGGSGAVTDANRAVLTEIGSERQTMTAETITDVLQRSYTFQRTVVAITATLRVPVVFTPSGWRYNDRPVKVGAPFAFETVSGAMGGWILEMKLDQKTQRVTR